MAEYREIFGEAVQSLPSSTGTIEGQIWYDSSNTNFKLIAKTGSAAFATGGSLPAARQHAGQAGTQTATIVAGGQSPSTYNNNNSYSYDGSSWTATNNLGTARRLADMLGTQSLALLAGSGTFPPSTAITTVEEWDGTNWTAGGVIATARYGTFGGGTQNAAVIAGGSGPGVYYDDTEEYNGTAWSTVTLMPRDGGNGTSGADLQTDMYCVAGGPGNLTTSLVYDGTNWTAGASISGDGRRGCGGAMATSSGAGFVTCGETATVNPISTTEEWNGTSFSSSTACPTATRDPASNDGGTGAAGLVVGGYSTAINANVFEFTGSNIQETQTITTS